MIFSVWIPKMPPGINETYGISGKRMYKTKVAVDWSAKAALIIGAKAGEMGWEDRSTYYEISMVFHNWRLDVDAPIKLVIDVVATKLGFNDSRLVKQSSLKIKHGEPGVYIELLPYEEPMEKWNNKDYRTIILAFKKGLNLIVYFEDGGMAVVSISKVLPTDNYEWPNLTFTKNEVVVPIVGKNEPLEISWYNLRVLTDLEFAKHVREIEAQKGALNDSSWG